MALKRVIKKFARLGVGHKHREEVVYTLNCSSASSNEKEYQFQRPGWKRRVGAEICLCYIVVSFEPSCNYKCVQNQIKQINLYAVTR